MKPFVLLLLTFFSVAVLHAFWFLVRPEPPCAASNPSCEGGSAAPIYSLFAFGAVAVAAHAVILRRARVPVGRIAILTFAFLLASLAVIVMVALVTLRMYMAGHPT